LCPSTLFAAIAKRTLVQRLGHFRLDYSFALPAPTAIIVSAAVTFIAAFSADQQRIAGISRTAAAELNLRGLMPGTNGLEQVILSRMKRTAEGGFAISS
jgi:hypothetical protein